MKQTTTPKNRINSIDALRGFALGGIMLLHCMEHFDLTYYPQLESPFWQWVDNTINETLYFLFQGKSYAIFSLLFGLSFFIQMDSQADKGVDFRLRFLWRLMVLFVFGYINGLIYMGEFFIVYATLGVILIPLYKVPSKYLIILSILLFLQIPAIIQFVSLLSGNTENAPTALNNYMNDLYGQTGVYVEGSIWDVLKFNVYKGQCAKILWLINNFRYLQLIGLFIAGMLIGRSGIHKSEIKMVAYSKKVLPYAVVCFLLLYAVSMLLPHTGIKDYTLYVGTILFKSYANLGMMMIYICGFTILYYKVKSVRKVLDKIAPVGRMSVTNYMMQSAIGVFIFYGFGLNGAVKYSLFVCFLIGLAVLAFQICYSNWWIKRFYYGPMEWLWRTLTFFKRVPMRRK